jgi:NADP-dependent 3-hydroxy acid dehydrogenase YdfG
MALGTGGGTGIGRTSALALANAGARVVVSGRREKESFITGLTLTADGGWTAQWQPHEA